MTSVDIAFEMGKQRFMIVARLIELIVSVFLLVSGLIHMFQPYMFVYSVANYRLLPNFVSGVVAIWLPYLCICVALCIVSNFYKSEAIIIALCMFTVFFLAQLSVLVRGIDIDCGCFGHAESTIGFGTLMRPIVLGILLLASTRMTQRKADVLGQ